MGTNPPRVCCSSLLIEAPVLRCWQHATFPKRSNQNGVVTVPFHAVAGPAEQLQILKVIGAALTLRHDVIGEMLSHRFPTLVPGISSRYRLILIRPSFDGGKYRRPAASSSIIRSNDTDQPLG